MSYLSGYRIMWMMVLFDLPVIDPEERKAATGFRNFLLDQGFEMAQILCLCALYFWKGGSGGDDPKGRKVSAFKRKGGYSAIHRQTI